MELIREIIIPKSNSYILNLPDKLIGKKVEVSLAFEADPISANNPQGPATQLDDSVVSIAADALTPDQTKKIAEIRAIFNDNLIDLRNFKFNRDEANNYDE